MSKLDYDRRRFLKVSSASVFGAGLVLAMTWEDLPAKANDNSKISSRFQPNAWLKIDDDGSVTVYVVESEMGQGSTSLMPMILAEELEVAWQDIKVERAPLKPVYGYQYTGGSASIRKGWATLRSAGAVAREMLISAAVQQWAVNHQDCYADNSYIIHQTSGKKLSFAELISTAASLPLPEHVRLKIPEEYKILGRAVPRLDIPQKVDGSAQFGIDVQLPDTLYATTVHCPVIGGKPKKIDDTQAKAISGVRHIFPIDNAVAVVAEDTWTSMKAAGSLDIEWDNGSNVTLNSKKIRQQLQQSANKAGKTNYQHGDISKILNSSNKVSASYDLPFQAHAPMEPMNCTAVVDDERCELWVPTQSPSAAKNTAIKYGFSKVSYYMDKVSSKLGFAERDRVDVHTTLLGGGFGRRLKQDYVAEAVQIAKEVGGPVKLVWSRQEDMRNDFYHPQTFHLMEGSIDADGKPLTWWHRLSGVGKVGAAKFPYEIPNVKIDIEKVDIPVPTGPWRSVSHHYYAFAQETFFDELAYLGKQDPLTLRLDLIKDSRLRGVLELAADKAGWSKALPEGHFLGVAAHFSFGTYVAEVVEIALDENAQIQVLRVVVAIDCGIVINPDVVRAQMEGSVVFGLSAALKGGISIEEGRIQQSNYHDFSILQMHEMPVVETYIMESNESPQGIGEPGVPPLAPALANAVFAATRVPIRSLPLSIQLKA